VFSEKTDCEQEYDYEENTIARLPVIVIDSRRIQTLAHIDEVKVIKKAISTKQFD
jgi:hypothetical protein